MPSSSLTVRSFTAAFAALASAAALAGTASAEVQLPPRMGAIGDSITTGYGAAGAPTDSTQHSFATGGDVLSHLERLRAMDPGISGQMLAKAGTRIGRLVQQTKNGAPFENQIDRLDRSVEYVTVTTGSADLCQGDRATGKGSFAKSASRLMEQLRKRLGDANIVILPVPDWVGLWENLKDNQSVRDRWAAVGVCSRVFGGDATSRAEMDTLQKVYNGILADACHSSATVTFKCFFASPVLDIAWTEADVSSYDGFHPSPAGQAKLSKAAWAVSPYRLAKWGVRFNTQPAFNRRKKTLRLNFNTAPNARIRAEVRNRKGRLLGATQFNATATGGAIRLVRTPNWTRNIKTLKLTLKISLTDETMTKKRTLRL